VTVTLFVLGFGVGPLAFSPLSEMYGRQPIFFVSLGLYFAFTFPSAFAPNAASMVVGRALAGIAASAPMTVIGGTIADMWELRDRGLPMALFSGTVFIGREWGKPWAKSSLHAFADFPALPSTAVIGPVIAGYLSAAGWRWNYYLLLIIVGISWVCTTIFLPETYAPVLLRHRAAKLRKETGDPTYMTEQERHKRSLSEIIKIALFRPMEMLFTEPIILFITVSIR
jgi:MFS family permease